MKYRKDESQQIIAIYALLCAPRCDAKKKLHYRHELAKHNLKADYLNDFERKNTCSILIHFSAYQKEAFVGCFSG